MKNKYMRVESPEDGIDTWFTDEIICPWCGYKIDPDPSEWENGEHDCDECGKPFFLEINYDISYTTAALRIDLGEAGEPDAQGVVEHLNTPYKMDGGACELLQ